MTKTIMDFKNTKNMAQIAADKSTELSNHDLREAFSVPLDENGIAVLTGKNIEYEAAIQNKK